MKSAWILPVLSLVVSGPAAGAEGGFAKPTGYAGIEGGQFVRFKYQQEDWTSSWRQRAYVNLATEMVLNDKLRVFGGLSAFMWYNTFPKARNGDNLNFDEKHVDMDISRGEGVYSFGDPDHPLLEAGLGIFPYKYNPEVRNLGEYLFRSGAYPNFILGDFDNPVAQLTGLRLSRDFFGSWHNDVLLTTETDIWPHFDWTLSYIADWGLGGFLNVGAGAAFTNLISVDEDKTTPNPAKVDAKHGDGDRKYVGYLDGGDTLFYTFRSIKLMGRITFNPLSFLSGDLFGSEDGKLYAEVAVLGWKNYPLPIGLDTLPQYSFLANRSERMPVVFGVNIPTCKLLDVLAVEVEHYGLRGPNSFRDRKEDGLPLPQSPSYWADPVADGGGGSSHATYDASDYIGKDDWKWSVYARRTLLQGFQIVGQVARDHVRHSFDSPIQLDREEALTKRDNWWWALKLAFFY